MNARIVPNSSYYEHWINVKYVDDNEVCYEVHVEDGSVLEFPRMENAVRIDLTSTEEHDNDGYTIRLDRARCFPNLRVFDMVFFSISFEDFSWLVDAAPLTTIDADIRFAVPGSYIFPQTDILEGNIIFTGDGPYSVDFGDYSNELDLSCNDNVRYIRAKKVSVQGAFDVIEADIDIAHPDARGIIIGNVKSNRSQHLTIYETRAEYEAIHGELIIPRAKNAAN